MRRHSDTILAPGGLAAILIPSLAAAWTPYGAGPPWATGTEANPEDAAIEAPAEPDRGTATSAPGFGMAPPPGDYGPPWAAGPGAYGYPSPPPPPSWWSADQGIPRSTPDSGPGYWPAFGAPGFGEVGPPWMGQYGPPWGPSQAPSYPATPWSPDSRGDGYSPEPPPDPSAEGPEPPMGYARPPRRPGSLRISQQMTDEAYVLEIQLDGERPEAIQIEPQGRGLLVRRETSAQIDERDTFDDGRGYARRYSYSTGRTARRLNVPPDGDLAALTREDAEDSIRVTIPRRQP